MYKRQEINLEKEIVDLDKNLFSAKGYYYAGILSGKFLDENVGTNRTSFDISDTAEDESEISMDDICLLYTSIEGVGYPRKEYFY